VITEAKPSNHVSLIDHSGNVEASI
ncbi:uncharacterized protein METZ01_LOCUS407602, partial [marine metagenome]